MNKFIKLTIIIILHYFSLSLIAQKNKNQLLKEYLNPKNDFGVRFNYGHDLVKNHYLKTRLDSAYIISNELFRLSQNTEFKADALMLLGLVDYNLNNYESASEFFKESLKIYKTRNYIEGEIDVLNNIGLLFNNQYRYKESNKYLKQALLIAEQTKDSISQIDILANIGFVLNNSFKTDSATVYLHKALKLAETFDRPAEFILSEIGRNYIRRKNYDKALEFYNKALQESRNNSNKNTEASVLFHISTQYIFQKKFIDAIVYGEQSLTLAEEIKNPSYISGSLLNLYEAYKELGNDKMALYYLEQNNSHDQMVEEVEFNRSLQEFEIREIKIRDSLSNEKEILKQNLEYQKEKNNLTLAWGGSLSAVSIIAFLVYRNTKRKQRKAEEERQKQIEEKEKILKDLELSTIDAMIQGQEKERQRLAADLHDSVGATLSAAKLQFNHLIKDEIDTKIREELIKKTSTLLEDAYVEIRSMAHLKNSGVMAKNGLLPAIEKLTENASGINNLSFEVQSFGLDKRLDNTLEITIFRIIQELVTNIIKHAKATKGTIHLTNHKDMLNIMVEDNGIGFNPKQITKTKKGMGIDSIDKRIEHLDGQMTIESEKNNGTTIIIDIPI